MNEITLTKNREKPVLNVWQWDKGQKLSITGLDLTDCTMQWSGAYLPTGTTTDNRDFTPLDGKTDLESGGVCDIPDAGLEDADLLTGYIYADISGECETVAKVTVQPVPRAMPADYVSPANTVTLEVLIDERIAQSGAGILTVDKFSELPETGTIALVENDEVITQAQSNFEADTEYSLFVNPQIPLDVDFEVAFIQSESEFDNGAISLTLNTTELSHPVFLIEARITDGQNLTIKQWYYAESQIVIDDFTILAGWSSVDTVNGVITKNESISYTDLPNLGGTFVEVNSLGGTYFSETPYNMNKAGLYEFNGSWERVDNDKSLWCSATGLLAAIGSGYGNTVGGVASFIGGGYYNYVDVVADGGAIGGGGGNNVGAQFGAIGGGYGNYVGGDWGAIGGGYGNYVDVDARYGAIGGGYGNYVDVDARYGAIGGGYGNYVDARYGAIGGGSGNSITSTGTRAFIGAGQNLIASAPDSAIFGRNGETDTDTLFAVANGTSIDNKSLALNIESTQATWTIPVLGVTADALDSSTNLATTAFVQGEISTKELKSNKVTTIDAQSTDDEYPSAKAVFDFVPEIDVDELVPTMTEYATVLTLNKGNYWTTTASIEFGLPTPIVGKVNTFDLFVKVANSAHIVTFSAVVEWAGSVAYVFGEGTHKVCGEYDPINSKWLLTATAAGVPA